MLARCFMLHGLIDREKVALVLIDFQEKFVPLMPDQNLEKRIERVLNIASIMKVPLIYNEQYPKGLGKTSASLLTTIANYQGTVGYFEKTLFSCCTPEFNDYLKRQFSGPESAADSVEATRQVVLMGIETHVCVTQTAFDLRAQGYQVILLEDCIGSRNWWLHNNGVNQLRTAGFRLANTENFAFELLRDKNHPNFKEISNLLKDASLLPN